MQGELFHPGLLNVSQDTLEAIGLGLDLKNLWQDQARTVYSHYFVARYRFWKRWFEFSEKIFAISEEHSTPLSQKLNRFVQHRETSDRYQMKIFIMERLVCALLEKLRMNAAATFNFRHQRKEYNQAMKAAGKELLDFSQFFLLDALKGQYLKTGQASFLNLYHHINTSD